MKNTELEQLINEKLNSAAISDYAPNGLQVEGKETVQKIVTGVTASQALLDEAVRLGWRMISTCMAGICRLTHILSWAITHSWRRYWGSRSWAKLSRWCRGES